jgi:hypothetical protein
MASKKKAGIDPTLEKAIGKLLKEVMASTEATITDKMKVIDRALKLEAIKQKMGDDTYGSGFFSEDSNDDQQGG